MTEAFPLVLLLFALAAIWAAVSETMRLWRE
jgi:hypothetical protein